MDASWREELKPHADEPRGSAGWRLAKSSWKLACQQQAIRGLVFMLAVVWAGNAYLGIVTGLNATSSKDIAGVIAIDAVFAVVGVFLLGAIAAAADAALDGAPLDLGEALAEARERSRPLLWWAGVFLAVWIGAFLLARHFHFRPALPWIQFAWYVAIFFVIPLAVLGDLGPGAGLRESLWLLRRRRRECFAAVLGIGLLAFLAIVPGWLIAEHAAAVYQEHGQRSHLLTILSLLLLFGGFALAMATKEAFAVMLVRDELDDLSPREYAGGRLGRREKVLRFCGGALAVFAVFAIAGAISKHDRHVTRESSAPGSNYTTIVSSYGVELPSESPVLYGGRKIGEVLGSEHEGSGLRVRFHVEPGFSPTATPAELVVEATAGQPSLVLKPTAGALPGSSQL
ncbi:MAG: hypothetical protein ACTHNP_04230 [Solirubrobacterales bacterium]